MKKSSKQSSRAGSAKKSKIELELTCVGIGYRVKSQKMRTLVELTMPPHGWIGCHLELEPDNEYDSDAVKVVNVKYHLGYVRRPSNQKVAKLLRNGALVKQCILQDVDPDEAGGSGRLFVTLALPSK